MRRTLCFLILVICSACESKPVQVAKATPKGTPRATAPSTALYSAILEIRDTNSPRPLADQVFSDPAIQNCLRDGLMKSGDDFSVSISGQLSAKGGVSDVQVEHQYDSLRDCLGQAMPKLKLGPGDAGAFKIEISRSRVTPPPGKTYELDLNPPKKFQ